MQNAIASNQVTQFTGRTSPIVGLSGGVCVSPDWVLSYQVPPPRSPPPSGEQCSAVFSASLLAVSCQVGSQPLFAILSCVPAPLPAGWWQCQTPRYRTCGPADRDFELVEPERAHRGWERSLVTRRVVTADVEEPRKYVPPGTASLVQQSLHCSPHRTSSQRRRSSAPRCLAVDCPLDPALWNERSEIVHAESMPSANTE